MKRRHVCISALLFFALASGCALSPTSSMQPVPAARIAVFPPNNETGDPLLVSGASALERYVLRTDRVTVPDILASEARLQLEQDGFIVVSPVLVDAAAQLPPVENLRRFIAEGADLVIETGIEFQDGKEAGKPVAFVSFFQEFPHGTGEYFRDIVDILGF